MLSKTLLMLAFLFPFAGSAAASPLYALGGATRPEDLDHFPRWKDMLARYEKQQKIKGDSCDDVPFHSCGIFAWKGFIRSLRGKPFMEQLDAINDYVNSFPYRTDRQNWGVDNHWETPYEFLEVSGNCKDYAITKYFSLRLLGLPQDRLRLLVVQDLHLGGAIHAVLGVNGEDGELYILDNQVRQVKPAGLVTRYKPLFNINETSVAAYAP